MIEYIKGKLDELTPTVAVVEAAGVGYALNISLTTYESIQGKDEVKLYVHEVLTTGGRDDSYTLYGFASKDERTLYRLLITVSGVGGNTARLILSSLSPAELCSAISSGDERILKGVKGIGLKTAQRIIVDLKDKIASLDISASQSAGTSTSVLDNSHAEIRQDAISALQLLGFSPAPSAKAVDSVISEFPDYDIDKVLREALKRVR